MSKITRALYQSCISDIQKHLRISDTSKKYREEIAKLFTGKNNSSTLLEDATRHIIKTYNGHMMPATFVWSTAIKDVKMIDSVRTPPPQDDIESGPPATAEDLMRAFEDHVKEHGSCMNHVSFDDFHKKTMASSFKPPVVD